MRKVIDSRGMTLVEILAGLVILSIVALVALRYLGSGLTASGDSVAHVRDQESVSSVMERITVTYNRMMETDPYALAALKTAIGNAGEDKANAFGTYTVVQNAYIAFDAGNSETPDSVNLNVLKVKIKVGPRQMVSIFTY
jgi:prepilin-type N-terminal cleavage/methylation domain-containing protein